MKKNIFYSNVVLCGGSGKRLWPLSRNNMPKQFTRLPNNIFLFKQLLQRFNSIDLKEFSNIEDVFVTNENQRFLLNDNLSGLNNKYSILLEPSPKNTAPALTLAALKILEINKEDVVMIVSPSDHLIQSESINISLQKAIISANKGSFVTFGIKPTVPEIGYGYIQVRQDKISDDVFDVESFYEKPNLENASQYIKNDNFYWNSGIFVVKASVWLDLYSSLNPNSYNFIKKSWVNKLVDDKFIRPDPKIFIQSTSDSIDYAVVEKINSNSNLLKMCILNDFWTDLGSWNSIYNFLPKDKNGNYLSSNVFQQKSKDSLVYSNKLVVCNEIDNLIVVDTKDAIFISKKESADQIKDILNHPFFKIKSEIEYHSKVYRPWGWFETINEGGKYKVKKLHIKPNSSISLQKHKIRSEHWVIVKGQAVIIFNDETRILNENESIYIPADTKHRLINDTEEFIEIIEVQTGLYLGEDDIIRYEDQYNRKNNEI